jgi:TolB-like protein/DNA-binding winged helix-turn-helix (wHTH) protein
MNAQSGPEPHLLYEFGEFRLDPVRRLMYARNGSTALPVKPKVLDALLLFVEHPGALMEKEQLLKELWPGMVIEENGLAQVISSLRRVLGETSGENRYLATVPGRGYRFVADVVRVLDRRAVQQNEAAATELNLATAVSGAARPDPASIAPDPPANRGSSYQNAAFRHRAIGAIAALAVLLAIALLLYGASAGWWGAHQTSRAARSSDTALPDRTVAVLPFENRSADADDAYFAFGLAQSTLHRLASLPGLTVIARTSSFAVGEHPADARSIGRTLNARYLVEGSVQRAGERLRVTAQLIDANTGGHLWSLRFDRTVADIFTVEDDIARNIATALDVSLDRARHPYAAFGVDAYLAFLRGRELMATRRNEDAERAIEHFKHAIEIAPNFAAAHAALARALWQVALYRQSGGTGEVFRIYTARQREMVSASVREVQPVLDRALQLDATVAEAYVLRGDLKANMDDNAGAEADYRKALELSPNYGEGHEHLAEFLWEHSGREEEALREMDRAISVDPLSPRHYYFVENNGAFTEAETYFLKALAVAPDYHPALLWLGVIRWHQGRFAEAVLLAERALAIDPRVAWMRRPLAEVYLEVGDVDAARSVLLEAPETVPPKQWLAICLYEKQAERAAELVRADPINDGFIDADTPGYALRDAALSSGRLIPARDEFKTLLGEPPLMLGTLAHLNLALGDRPEAERQARRALEEDDRVRGDRLDYSKAAALTVLAQNDAALDLLERGYARGYRKGWWYAFQRDSAFGPLRGDLRFEALAAKAQAHAAAERETIRQMRDRGQIPKRTPKKTVKAGIC